MTELAIHVLKLEGEGSNVGGAGVAAPSIVINDPSVHFLTTTRLIYGSKDYVQSCQAYACWHIIRSSRHRCACTLPAKLRESCTPSAPKS